MKFIATHFPRLILAFLMTSTTAFGLATYTSTASGNWSTMTWAPPGTPGPTDTVVIANTHVVTLTADDTCAAVTVNSGGVLDISTFKLGLAGKYSIASGGEGRQGAFNPVPGGGATPWAFNSSSTYTIGGTATGFSIGGAPGITFGFLKWNSSANGTLPNGTVVSVNLTLGGAGEMSCGTGAGSSTVTVLNDVIVNSGTLVVSDAGAGGSATLSIGGGLTIGPSGTLRGVNDAGSGTIIITKDLINNGTCAVGAGSGSYIMRLVPTPGSPRSFSPGATNMFGNIVVTGLRDLFGNNVNIASGCTFTDSAYFDCNTRQIVGAGNFVLAPNAVLGIRSAAGITSSGALGDIQVTGSRSFSTQGLYQYYSSVPQQTGSGLPANVKNLRTNGPSTLTLTSSVTVDGTLELNFGVLHTGGNVVEVAPAATLTRFTGRVWGNLKKTIVVLASAGTQNFEIGDSTQYTPVLVAGTGYASDFTLTASTTPGDHLSIAGSGIDAVKSVNRYYTLTGTPTGPSNITFNFVAGDLDGGANTAAFNIAKYNSPTWSPVTAGTRTATSTQATGVISFSDFVIGELAPAAPGFTVSPSTVSFGNVVKNDCANDTVIVKNNGTSLLTVDSVRVYGGEFSVNPNGSSSIAVGDSAAYAITFCPTASGAQSAGVVFYHNAVTSPDTVAVTGAGVLSTPAFIYGSTLLASLITIDQGTGASALVANSGIDLFGISVRPSDGAIFAIAGFGNSSLYTLDALTAVPTFIGNLGQHFDEIEFGPGDVLYGLTNSNAYSINTSNAVSILLHSFPNTFTAIAFDPTTGTCYGTTMWDIMDPESPYLYTVNLNAGTVTLVGGMALEENSFGLCFDQAGNLFASVGGGPLDHILYAVSKATGDTTLIGSTGISSISSLAKWVTFGPAIGIKASLTPFSSVAGSPSSEQSYTVGGGELTNNIVVTPPADFEISLASGSGFTASPIVLTQSGGMVATTPIYVRMNRATPGSPLGNITHTSTGAAQKNVAVSGTAIPPGPPPKFTTISPDSIAALDVEGKLVKAVKRKRQKYPNWTNLIEEVVAQGGFSPKNGSTETDSAGGEVIGITFMYKKNPADTLAPKWTPKKQTSKSDTAWARLSAWDFKKSKGKSASQISKTMRNKAFNHWISDPTGTPRGFDSTYTPGVAGRKQLKKQMTKLDPKKTPNKLFAELVAFKFNIASSQLGNTPAGFGDLIYDADSSMYDEMSLMAISQRADTMMTFWKGVDSTVIGDSTKYAQLYRAVYDVNRAFIGVLDTANFENVDTAADPPFIRLRVGGNVELADVPFLKQGALRPTMIRPASHDTETEEDFEDGDYFEDDEFGGEGTPIAAKLYQNYPNPFNPVTTISFRLNGTSSVTLKIYNVLGQEVETLLNQQEMDEGYQTVEFNPSGMASGVYFYRINVEDQEGAIARVIETKKMLLLK